MGLKGLKYGSVSFNEVLLCRDNLSKVVLLVFTACVSVIETDGTSFPSGPCGFDAVKLSPSKNCG